MAAILRDYTVVVVRTRPREIPLAMIAARAGDLVTSLRETGEKFLSSYPIKAGFH